MKRGNNSLEDIAIIGTDECDELFDGILDESQGNSGHLLGKEHVFKNVQKKLENLRFPRQQSKWICADIFGDPFDKTKKSLMDCKNGLEFEKHRGRNEKKVG